MNPFKVIADNESDQKALLKALQQLGPVTEEAGYWTAIANDDSYSRDHRRRAIFALFQRHVRAGLTLYQLAEIVDNPTWLRDEDVTLVTVVSGRLPVKWSPEDTIFILHVFSDLPDRHYDHWAIYISVSGEVELQSIRDILHGRPVDQRVAKATILDIGLVPDDQS